MRALQFGRKLTSARFAHFSDGTPGPHRLLAGSRYTSGGQAAAGPQSCVISSSASPGGVGQDGVGMRAPRVCRPFHHPSLRHAPAPTAAGPPRGVRRSDHRRRSTPSLPSPPLEHMQTHVARTTRAPRAASDACRPSWLGRAGGPPLSLSLSAPSANNVPLPNVQRTANDDPYTPTHATGGGRAVQSPPRTRTLTPTHTSRTTNHQPDGEHTDVVVQVEHRERRAGGDGSGGDGAARHRRRARVCCSGHALGGAAHGRFGASPIA